jgi:hypothetical protein
LETDWNEIAGMGAGDFTGAPGKLLRRMRMP